MDPRPDDTEPPPAQTVAHGNPAPPDGSLLAGERILAGLPERFAPLDRRGFVAAGLATGVALAAGFTLAAGPVAAGTAIVTDTKGLTTGMVHIPASGFAMPAYFARPEHHHRLATVLVVQEIFGLHAYIQDICRRLAKLGYLAVAPDLYAREADMSKVTSLQDAVAVMRRVPDAQVLADLDATAAWAVKPGLGDPDRMAITGFCWGGRITWLYAEHNPHLRAAVAWYGFLDGPHTALTPHQPIDLVDRLKVPVLALMGGADKGNPPEVIARMEAKLKAAGKTADFVVYPGAPHAFHADYRPSYRREAAEDGWRRMLAWFAHHGAA